MKITNDIIKAVTDNYGYHFASWQPKKIKNAIDKIDENVATILDYSNANALAQSLSKIFAYDITSDLIENKYPVWVDPINAEEITPVKDKVVITYIENPKETLSDSIRRLEEYAKFVDADLVVLTGRTQGLLSLEIGRIKKYVEAYNRTIFFSIDLYIKDDCPNLFDIVPDDQIGIHDSAESLSWIHPDVTKNMNPRMFLLKADYFQRFPLITHDVSETLKYEASLMNTCYDKSVIVCSKSHADIWEAISFPFLGKDGDDQRWLEILIYRNGHDVFNLDSVYNQNITNLDENKSTLVNSSFIIKYSNNSEASNVKNAWLYDNNLIGYKQKDPMNMDEFDIKVLYHTDKQLSTIENREYLSYIDLNNITSDFGYSFTESRMFYYDFDKLFTGNKPYVGLVTGSWNKKYIGLNPIDKMHDWAGIRHIEQNVVICSDIFPSARFIGSTRPVIKPVVKDVFHKITPDQLEEFIALIGLEKINKDVGVSNQIIAKRDIVKSLFDFYQNNQILEKIDFFLNKHELECINEDVYLRRHGYFAETTTVLWMTSQDFITMPQEILKKDWYW